MQTQERGGIVHVLGDEVHLLDSAEIDVSAAAGGGEVLIGGDNQGKNPKVRNAKYVWAGPGTRVLADALENGDGGKVIFWSDEATFHYGKISVRGGENGGDGGFVEVSGPMLEYKGFTDATAAQGKPGELLLDPTDVVIGSTATTGTFSACVPPVSYNFVTGTQPNQILFSALQTQLGSCNVTINTASSGGSGPNGGSITVSSAVTWSAATTLTLTAASSMSISASVTNTSATTGFTAMNFTANGVGATSSPGITLATGGVLTANGGNITLNGTSSTATNASYGVFFNGGSIATTSGNISVTGLVPVGATTTALFGIYMNTTNGMTSSSGNITLSGTANTSGNAGYGIYIDLPWTTGTTGTLTFQNCMGGTGTNTYGVVVQTSSPLSTSGNITAINNIKSGLGISTPNSGGFYIGSSISSTGGGNIQITASCTLATAGTASGIGISMISTGGMNTTGNGTITLIGTGSAISGATSYGVSIASGASGVTTVNGAISVVGNMPGGTQTGIGVLLGTTNSLKSTTGPINVSGTSSSSGASSHGVSITSAIAIGTSGTVTFSNCSGGTGTASHGVNLGAAFTSSGPVVFTNCVGGNNGTTGGNGINVGTAAFTTAGNITATTFITGQGNGGIGFFSNQNFSATGASNAIAITASSTGTTGNCHGISLTGGSLSTTGGGSITLNGTSGASSTVSYGVYLSSGTITTATGSGNIFVTGVVPVGGYGSWCLWHQYEHSEWNNKRFRQYYGQRNQQFKRDQRFWFVQNSAWSTGTTGTLTFQNCVGGAGANCVGIVVGGTLSNGGNIIATNNISAGTGNTSSGSAIGFFTDGSISSTNGSIQITASAANATAGSGAGDGVVLSGGTISVTGANTITLVGIGGPVGVGSTGILLQIGSTVTSGSGLISLTGSISGGTGSYTGISITSGNITSTSGPINISGTSSSSGASSHGVSITSAITTGTSGTVTFSNCSGGTGIASHGVNLGAAFTSSGPVVFTNCVGGNNGTTGGNGINMAATFTTAGNITATTSITGQGNGRRWFCLKSKFWSNRSRKCYRHYRECNWHYGCLPRHFAHRRKSKYFWWRQYHAQWDGRHQQRRFLRSECQWGIDRYDRRQYFSHRIRSRGGDW